MAILTEQVSPSALAETEEREAIFDVFRRWGYLQSWLDPLGQYLPPEQFPVPTPTGPIADEAREFYSKTFGVEFMHISSPEQRLWIQRQVEEPTPRPDQHHVLTQLIRADIFEQVVQSRYMGTKRFSLEGLTVLIPFLDEVLRVSYLAGASKAILAMSHRGRLNVMTNVIGRPPAEIFAEFEDVDPRSVLGGGDVKYHIGATGEYHAEDGGAIALHLASNPSHLEAVDPIVLGRARARQQHLGSDGDQKVLPIMIHGDAAFAGQGIVAESLVLGSLPGYEVGGTVHVIVNNLLGFTALPQESNCSRFASDLAKRLPIPIFHVNAEDPDAVIRVAGIAARFRSEFHTDVLVDIIGYRRHGHSEVDDPTVTQPIRYALIKSRPYLYQLYAEQMQVDPSEEVKQIQDEFLADQKTASLARKKPRLARIPSYWDPYIGGPFLPEYDVPTGLAPELIAELCQHMTQTPDGFHIHPKVEKLYEQRIKMGAGEIPFDYGAAELLAFASLLEAGTPVRLSGQDSQRGTFSQRHAVLVDIENEQRYFPLQHLSANQARFEVYNSMLSEAAVLGFEYGYSRDSPEVLVLWEAQFGDFANGAQIIIDQFIAAGEAKWNLLSGLVLLLPHGYEGQGPEHSSARVERYLQLAASENIQICQPSTAAQYFHLLRRQALRKWRKPLVVFTPKSMLRSADASSPRADFFAPHFRNVIADDTVKSPSRILVCTGKVGHTLRAERGRRKDYSVAIITLEQLYPWPEQAMQAALDQHPHATEIVWVQEEPANMGALTYALPHLRRMAADRAVLSVKRSASASPATGSAKAHALEEKALIDLAFGA